MQHPNQIKKITLTIPQASALLSKQLNKFLIWGRGGGKSTIQGGFMRKFVGQMPRASFFLSGATFSQILSKTLPSTIEGLEMFGLYQDIDYVIGRSGKGKGFAMPYQAPQQWNNVIHWSNGAIFQMVSQDNENSGRGLNAYGGMGDEIQSQDRDKLYNSAQTTNRAQKEIFKDCDMLGAEVYTGSMPLTKKAAWIFDYQKLAKDNPKDYYFSMASALSNPFLRPDWFKRMKDNAPSELLYNAEILNIRPKEITDGFYANLNPDRHYRTDFDNHYLEGLVWVPKEKGFDKAFDCRQDNDLDRKAPLILSFDFGVFNSLVVSQERADLREYRVLNSMWAKSPKLLDDLILEQFLPYYATHHEKRVYLYGGHDGNNRQPNSSRTLFQQVEDLLRSHGWSVHLLTRGAAARHSDKYLLVNAMLKEHNPKLYKIRINQHNCADLIISLERAEAIEGNTGVEKQKKDERNKSLLQQHTTHLSDAFDIPILSRYMDSFKGNINQFAGESQIRLIS